MIAVTALAAATLLLLPVAAPDHEGVTKAVARSASRPRIRSATVTVSRRGGVLPVPRSFLGLSTEYWSIPSFERHPSAFDNVLTLIHARGEGPVILRVGGDSADRTFVAQDVRRRERWMFETTPAWFRALRAVVRATGARVIVDLNLVTGSAAMAAQEARQTEAALPRGSVVGFEVGNEPDIYSHHYWAWATSAGRANAGLLPRRFTPTTYAREFQAYRSAIWGVAPNVPLIGPVIANPKRNLDWVSTLLDLPHEGLGMVSVHRYPYSACARRDSRAFPTISRVLSEKASTGLARSVLAAVRLAHRAGLPLRVTELNSVTCGGREGVSNAFATALWAPDALFEMLRAGVNGVNVHVRQNKINAAFLMRRAGLQARPLLYGLALFARALGPGAGLVDTHVRALPSLNLKAWAVRLRSGDLHVVLIDKGPHPVRVDLRVSGAGPAMIQRLLAPSVFSRGGVTLAGQSLGTDGSWHGRRVTEVSARSARGYELLVPRFSAALVTIRARGRVRPRLRGHRRNASPVRAIAPRRPPRRPPLARRRGIRV